MVWPAWTSCCSATTTSTRPTRPAGTRSTTPRRTRSPLTTPPRVEAGRGDDLVQRHAAVQGHGELRVAGPGNPTSATIQCTGEGSPSPLPEGTPKVLDNLAPDRKSTRLNSSHVRISYAVFCLK